MKKLPVVVVVGRPNVGKSSLFNRIVRRRAAVVSNREGVTRDRHIKRTNWDGSHFDLVDTGGFLVDENIDIMADDVRKQITIAIESADLVLFMTDVRVGITKIDQQFAKMVLKSGKKAILVTNKAEENSDRQEIYEFLKLGLGDPFTISAKTGYGMISLMEEVFNHIPTVKIAFEDREDERDHMHLAILGRPNAGKSTLINRLLREERMITSDVAGTTRDSVDIDLMYHGQKITLTDTAGLRKKAKVSDEVEYFSNMRSIESVKRSDVCIVMVDATRGVEEQDYRIMTQIKDHNKGLILILNKWDLMKKDTMTLAKIREELVFRSPELEYIPIITISATEGKRTHKIMEEAKAVYRRMHTIIGREKLIEVFQRIVTKNPHPVRAQREIKMLRCCQTITNPVVVTIECKHPDLVELSWKRYFIRQMRKKFDLIGAPLKLNFDEELELRSDEDLGKFLPEEFKDLQPIPRDVPEEADDLENVQESEEGEL